LFYFLVFTFCCRNC